MSWWASKLAVPHGVEFKPVGKLSIQQDALDGNIPDISNAGAEWLVNSSHCYHKQTIMLAYGGWSPIRDELKKYDPVTYWLIEPHSYGFSMLCEDETISRATGEDIYDISMIWNCAVDDWAEQFDPNGAKVDRIIMNPPRGQAALSIICLYPFLRTIRPRGQIASTIDYSELFAVDNKPFRRWLEKNDFTWYICSRDFWKGPGRLCVIHGGAYVE